MDVFERKTGGVAHLRFRNPPLNILSIGGGLVAALSGAVERAVADISVDAIILSGGEGVFSAGADINDFDSAPERIDAIRNLLDRIENAAKPVIAVIEGLCLGGGLELALAAHYRVASSGARFGFPEIGLGLLPGGGGTQRTPRLTGAREALDMMLSGRPISAARAAEIGLIDARVDGDPLAFALAQYEAGAFAAPRPVGKLPPPGDLDAAIAAQPPARTPAAQRIIACVERIGHGPLAQGLAFEAEAFAALMASPASKGLRHGFFGRRAVARIPGLAGAAPHPVRKVTVIGGGLMGTGIATALLNAGIATTIVEPREDARDRARQSIEATVRRDVEKGRVSAEVAARRMDALSVAEAIAGAAEADLFIEAVFEDMAVKQAVFAELDRVAPPTAIFASNTSTLDLDAIAGFTRRPDRVVGLHFFSPANVMKLLEVVRGQRTSLETLATAMAFARAIGKTGVVAGVCDGFIGNRIFEEYLRQAWFLLEEGALPEQVDRALEAFGMAMGPCRVMDLAGQDIGWSIRQRRAVEQPDRPYSQVPDRICERGRFGQKAGAGFYLYPDGRTPQVDPDVTALIEAESARIGLARRPIDDSEIVARCILAMVNEGARIVAEGIALRPVDIDIVYLDGYGFPAERGGPMFHADQQGLPGIVDAIRGYAKGRHGWAWEPSPLLIELAGSKRTFEGLNR